MPEMRFDVRWPDREVTRCYSPSLVISELLPVGSYPLFEFMERVRAGLNIGSERVRLKFGFYCSAAMDQLAELQERARRFEPQDSVEVSALYPPGVEMPTLAHDSAKAPPTVEAGGGSEP